MTFYNSYSYPYNRGRRKKSTRFSPGEDRQKEQDEDVFSPSSSSRRILQESSETDPLENEKIDSLISLPSLLIQEVPQERIDMGEKK